jgi:predicted Zn-dependent peptidase
LNNTTAVRSPGHIDFETYTLPNGLRVILHEDHKASVVCLNIAYHVGSKNEDVTKRGFAHLFEHLLFEGSKNVPRGAFDEHITHAGGYDNAYTTEDKTNYYEVLPSNQIELALWLESDRLMEFAITDISLATQKSVVKEEKLERYDNTPYGTLSIRINRLAYKHFPYWWAVIGDMETIDAATLEDVRSFFETYYVPQNATLVLAGDFERDQAKMLIEKYFSEIKAGSQPITSPPYEEPQQQSEERAVVRNEPVPLPGVFYAYKIPEETSRDYLALDLLTEVLATGQSSRMYRHLIYEKQIASEASSYVDGREMPGLCYLYAVARDPETGIDVLEQAIEEVIDEIKQRGVTEDELAKSKNKTEARMIASRLTVQGKADQLAHAAVIHGDPDRVNTILEDYRSITAEDIRVVAIKYLVPENRSTVVYEPEELLGIEE